jgi:hypothetical protein
VRFIDSTARQRLAIGICSRCSRKFPMEQLHQDPNAPGLLVCVDDLDDFDPWRLPARKSDDLILGPMRPDTPLVPGPMNVPVNPPQAILGGAPGDIGNPPIALAPPANPQLVAVPWTALTPYAVGAQVTPGVAVGPSVVGQEIYTFLCLIPGKSGTSAPAWNNNRGSFTTDGTVVWLNNGLYLP